MNARDELIGLLSNDPFHTEAWSEIKCLKIWTHNTRGKIFILRLRYKWEDFYKLLTELDFNYNEYMPSYGIYGFVWMQDGSWYRRETYDHNSRSEWKHYKCPNIPPDLF